MFDLRYYQDEARANVFAEWENHQATMVVMPTGTGKTELYLSIVTDESLGRAVVIGHRDYLLQQPIQRLAAVGFDNVAVEKAHLRSEGGLQPPKVTFASLQTLSLDHRLKNFNPFDFSTVVIDEAHRAVAKSYRKIVDHFAQNKRVRFLLLTATPKRKDGIAISNLCGGDISEAYQLTPSRAAREGWIVPLRFYHKQVEGLDFSHVKVSGSDLDPEALEAALLEEMPLHKICVSIAEDTCPNLVFCPTVKVARAYQAILDKRYLPGRVAVLWGESTDDERALVCRKLSDGEISVICNVDLYTEGLDIPDLVTVTWACPTGSLVKYTQGTGRCFRPHNSLRGRLRGGIDDAEVRRNLIAESQKPFGRAVTNFGSNCQHRLCTPHDILGGDELPPEIAKMAGLVGKITGMLPQGATPEEDARTAEHLLELAKLLETRRRPIKGKGQVKTTEYDGFGNGNRRNDLDVGAQREAAEQGMDIWPDGEPATEKQLAWLRYRGADVDGKGLTKKQAGTSIDIVIMGGHAPEVVTYSRRRAVAEVARLRKAKAQAG